MRVSSARCLTQTGQLKPADAWATLWGYPGAIEAAAQAGAIGGTAAASNGLAAAAFIIASRPDSKATARQASAPFYAG
jgi:hypothetical protein